ncbi:uncharacterized protein [Temnothorax longispinosus]|uniref:uncharacterized protein n=1 Tax=Temnothorax longispinosus TaxID=300112 RepID=UPI003A99259C
MTCHLTALEIQLCKFWNIEEIATRKPKSKEEIKCEKHFSNTVHRDSTGRYVVRLPFREENHCLGESRTIALKRLISLKRKLNANATLKMEYTRVIEEYLKLGHMSIIEFPEEDGFYMPHHAVIKESSHTTKVRVVFDASAKTSNGVFLNDLLMTGLTIQNKLFAHLIRFRIYVVVITADIEKMYRQVLYAKKIMQDVWRCGLHGFCDASNIGYGACLYVRSRGKNGKIVTRLLCAKSRVAPLKLITIPRLELCGALLLARLYRETISELGINIDETTLWCDATTVLQWLKISPHLLKTYVANRVAEIQELSSGIKWRHVRSEDNPADAISRGQLPHAFLKNRTWFTGPPWLGENEGKWPNERIRLSEIPETKTNTCLTATSGSLELFEKYSSYSKLCRIIAYCRRFRHDNQYIGSLCAEEINEAEIRILRLLQATQFSEEIKILKNKHVINQGKLASLNPFLDKNDLIRVGGRLQKSQLTFSRKHPILLPNRHRLTDQIIHRHKTLVDNFSSERCIKWHFIPPIAPHFGGLWESTVKLFKHHFRRVVGDSLFTFEEAKHFHNRDRRNSKFPSYYLSFFRSERHVRQDFWARWNLEYLNELQKRHKWTKDGPELNIGTVVLLKEKNQPCLQWALGKITTLIHPGEYGVA